LISTEDPHVSFPRQQLKYLRELGRGWFGRVSRHLYLYSENGHSISAVMCSLAQIAKMNLQVSSALEVFRLPLWVVTYFVSVLG
jgi:hypothetical protein